MTRLNSQIKMGYYEILPEHYEGITGLLNRPMGNALILDPCAGEGDFLAHLAKKTGTTPYANELDVERAEVCKQKFGNINSMQGDIYNLTTDPRFGLVWLNPPYSSDSLATGGTKRMEFSMLKHVDKHWMASGSVMMWCVYTQHITSEVIGWWAENYHRVRIFHLEGKHLDQYDQVVMVGVKGEAYPRDTYAFSGLIRQRDNKFDNLLSKWGNVKYNIPTTTKSAIEFSSSKIDDVDILDAIARSGAHLSPIYTEFTNPRREAPEKINSITPPRPGHLVIAMLSATNGSNMILDGDDGKIIIRSTVRKVRSVNDSLNSAGTPISVITISPKVVVSITDRHGTTTILEKDSDIIRFVTRYFDQIYDFISRQIKPIYQFDFGGESALRQMQSISLRGKQNALYTPQKHVVGAINVAFDQMRRQLLVGEVGVGKTLISSALIKLSWEKLPMKERTGYTTTHPVYGKHTIPAKIMMVVCPSHLREKWEKELRDVLGEDAQIMYTDPDTSERSFQQVSQFINTPNPNGVCRVIIVKTNDTKLGTPIEAQLQFANAAIKVSVRNAQGYWMDADSGESMTREWLAKNSVRNPLQKEIRWTTGIKKCPNCGQHIDDTIISKLQGKGVLPEFCPSCHSPLWQVAENPTPMEHQPHTRMGNAMRTRAGRVALADYILKKHRKVIHFLIVDEVHDCKSIRSANGQALSRLANCSKYFLGMTGTPFNGYSSSLFNLLYILDKDIRKEFPWGNTPRFSKKIRGSKLSQYRFPKDGISATASEMAFINAHGVMKIITKTDNEKVGYYSRTKKAGEVREAPGVSGMLISKMLRYTTFFGMSDLKDVPQASQISIKVPIEKNLKDYQEREFANLQTIAKQMASTGVFIMGSVFHWFRHIDQPHTPWKLETKGEVIENYNALTPRDYISQKEQELIRIVNEELALDPAAVVAIYCVNTGDNRDIQPRIASLFPGVKYHIVDSEPAKREKAIRKQIEDGVRILITNHEKVKTGLDFIWDLPSGYRYASAVVHFQLTYNPFTKIQADGRVRRANSQTNNRVYNLYYADSTDEKGYLLQQAKYSSIAFLLGQTGEGLVGINALTEMQSSDEEGMRLLLMQQIIDKQVALPQEGDDRIKALDRAMWQANADWDVIGYVPELVIRVQEPTKAEITPKIALVEVTDTHVQVYQMSLFGDANVKKNPRASRNRPRQQALLAIGGD